MKLSWIFFAVISLKICFFMAKDIALCTSVIENSNTDSKFIDGSLTLTSCPQEPGEEGIYVITLSRYYSFMVLCDAQIAGAGYTVIASRSSANLSFFRNWQEYKNGFGDLSDDFFLGLDKVHAITKSQTHELYIHLEDFDGNIRFARYDEFYIENENEFYKLSRLGAYIGDAGDSLRYHINEKFSTYDKDNDSHAPGNCAINYLGAWWYKACHHSNLFGMYLGGTFSSNMDNKGIIWRSWRDGLYSYKTMKMMVRPKCRCS